MSKYNIDIYDYLWYLVRENKTYYFVENPRLKITDEQAVHIKEVYDGDIGDCEFLYKKIIGPRRVVEKKGYALSKNGFIKDIKYFPYKELMALKDRLMAFGLMC